MVEPGRNPDKGRSVGKTAVLNLIEGRPGGTGAAQCGASKKFLGAQEYHSSQHKAESSNPASQRHMRGRARGKLGTCNQMLRMPQMPKEGCFAFSDSRPTFEYSPSRWEKPALHSKTTIESENLERAARRPGPWEAADFKLTRGQWQWQWQPHNAEADYPPANLNPHCTGMGQKGAGGEGVLILLQLGATVDGRGRLDLSAHIRAARTLVLYRQAFAAGRHCGRVLTSGGSPDESHVAQHRNIGCQADLWRLTADMLVARGLPEEALIAPGLRAYTTRAVEEALLASKVLHEFAVKVLELVVITSEYHAARAAHLFNVAFGTAAGWDIPLRVDAVPSVLPQEELSVLLDGFEMAPEISAGGSPFDSLEARVAHEAKALRGLKEDPFGPWLEFLQAHGLSATTRGSPNETARSTENVERELGPEWGGRDACTSVEL